MENHSSAPPENSREQNLVEIYRVLVTEATLHSWRNFQFLMRGAILISGASILTAVNFTASDATSFSDLWVSILLFSFAFFFSLTMYIMVIAVESDRADHYLKEFQNILRGVKSPYEFVGWGFSDNGKKKYFWLLALYVLTLAGGWVWLAPHA